MGAGLQTTVTGPTYDPDAQLFFNAQTAAGVTLTTTQMNAVNQWVVDSKAAGLWTKMKAVYPFVGSTATSQKFNLKNPLDTNAAFRLSFIGGGTHSSNGYQPNGINSYADTFLAPSTAPLTNNSTHVSIYSRTNSLAINSDIGSVPGSGLLNINTRYSDGNLYADQYNFSTNRITIANANSQGFYISTRTSSTVFKLFKNNAQFGSTVTNVSTPNITLVTSKIYISALNNNGVAVNFSNRECAFSTIGDGLTDLESQLFYQITEKYQVALSRNINTTQSFYYNPAYNNETNAFLFSTQITDNTIQTATNTLVTDLKTAGVFTKMKAIYPMVGGTATTHKFNLVNAQDSNAAFALSFIGGWTHSANGALPNGTNAYADTFFIPSVNGTLNSNHISYYSRTNSNTLEIEVGTSTSGGLTPFSILQLRTTGITYLCLNSTNIYVTYTDANSLGFYVGSRTAVNVLKLFKNAATIGTGTTTASGLPNNQFSLAAYRYNTGVLYYSSKQCAFASIGDGLTDAEALAFYNAVQLFNTTLARQV